MLNEDMGELGNLGILLPEADDDTMVRFKADLVLIEIKWGIVVGMKKDLLQIRVADSLTRPPML